VQQEKILLALGERIRQLREKKGISQEALSFEIEVHRTYVSLIEQARRYPSNSNPSEDLGKA
jgi:transcriptional regulator with XRE-family HTH domain